MRRYNEPIEVRAAEMAGVFGPAAFRWRHRLWRVTEIERTWFETANWWSDPGDDLLAESQVWRVVASAGAARDAGVFDLSCPVGGDRWLLRSVVD